MTFALAHPLGGNWIEVEAEDEYAAREVILKFFGTKWVFLYSEAQWVETQKFFPGGKVGYTMKGVGN